jgi:hypothetical protein
MAVDRRRYMMVIVVGCGKRRRGTHHRQGDYDGANKRQLHLRVLPIPKVKKVTSRALGTSTVSPISQSFEVMPAAIAGFGRFTHVNLSRPQIHSRRNMSDRFPRRALRRTPRRSNGRASIEKRCLIEPLPLQVEVRSTQLISCCIARPLEALARQSAVLICSRHDTCRSDPVSWARQPAFRR